MIEFAATGFGKTRHGWLVRIAVCLTLAASATAPAWAIAMASPLIQPDAASVRTQTIARIGCNAIASRVDASPGSTPILLRSYDNLRGQGAPDRPTLHAAAFTYDNALAVLALLACGKRSQAERVGEALRLAAMNDTRLRDVYRFGAVTGEKPLPNGWWDARRKRWIDAAHTRSGAYQDSTSCGNVAWTALALLTLYDATGQTRWRDAALRLAEWVVANTKDTRGAGGFDGGIETYSLVPTKALWKSTEHNIDLIALFDALTRMAAAGNWAAQASHARHFVAAQWDTTSGHFWMGSTVDGVTAQRTPSVLDAQLLAQLLPDAPQEWQRALSWIERMHAVQGGFDFTDARDGLWTEGTAQAALVYRQRGREADADTLFVSIAQQSSPGGFFYATREPRIAAIYATYYHQPHLGATAWAVLAALDRNPYIPADHPH